MDNSPGDILTIAELSEYLKIPKSTLYKLVREGKIPSHKIGKHWRFHKEVIDQWVKQSHETGEKKENGDGGSFG